MKSNLNRIALLVCGSLPSMPIGAQENQSSPDLTAGDGVFEISDIFARATLPNAPTGAVYLSLSNMGEEPDRLVSGTTSVAKDVQIHSMTMKDDVMQMRQLVDGIEIAPGEIHTFEPSGLHIMLIEVQQPLIEGETFILTLEFEHSGEIEIDVPIVGIGARSAPDSAEPARSGQ